jgi:hypothetical protein
MVGIEWNTSAIGLDQRLLACGPRTPGDPRLIRKLNNFSQQINKVFYVKKQNLKLKILKRSQHQPSH